MTRIGIAEADAGIWLVGIMHYDLGPIDLVQKTSQTWDNPIGPRLLPVSQAPSVTHVSGSVSPKSWAGRITLPAHLMPDPARQRRSGSASHIVLFRVCGTTCDSIDILSRPFWLPETVDTGDWIEIGHIGAYSMALRTRFNGFCPDTVVEVATPFDEAGETRSFASIEAMADSYEPLPDSE